MALARAALSVTDEVVFVLPRDFPHKRYEQVSLEDRLHMLLAATEDEPRFSVAVSDGGLFLEIAGECCEAYGPEVGLWFLCGRDAAERVTHWPYPEPGTVASMLEHFGLLVADRGGAFVPPETLRARIRRLPVNAPIGDISATLVRELIAKGEEWRHLVPESVARIAGGIY